MVKMKRRFFAQAEYQGAWQYFPDHLQQFTHNREVLPGMGEAFGSNVPQFAHYWTASAGLKMGNHFQLDVGRDKHFWGDGYRSMILSHNAAPYPYMRLTTKIWRVKYVNLWTVLKDISTDQTRTRYMSAHALSWNVTPAFNLSLFESVVWQEKDSLSQRGFEPSYLNPFIFYRPVEFAQGSGDNVLLGLSARVKVYDYATLYGQIYFDEFLMAELRRGEGWWANKFAVQLGAKAMDIASTGTNLLTEINLARPFTYTHGSVVQAYGHLNQALAHPLGTNFFEWLVSGSYTHKNLRYTFHHVLAYFGEDPDGLNYGTDIFKSYRNPALLYGNKIGQGTKNTLSTLRLGVEKDVNWGVPVVLNAELGLRKLTNQYDNPLDTWLMIGIRTPMVRPYRDF
jgi:hypothetical protein